MGLLLLFSFKPFEISIRHHWCEKKKMPAAVWYNFPIFYGIFFPFHFTPMRFFFFFSPLFHHLINDFLLNESRQLCGDMACGSSWEGRIWKLLLLVPHIAYCCTWSSGRPCQSYTWIWNFLRWKKKPLERRIESHMLQCSFNWRRRCNENPTMIDSTETLKCAIHFKKSWRLNI